MITAKAYCPRCGGGEVVVVEVGGVERTSDLMGDREVNVRLEVSFYTQSAPHDCKSGS